jgi:hypothetical protein
MKKVSYLLTAAVLILVLQGVGLAGAATTSFLVSASVPAATGVSITASRVNSATNAFTPVAGTNLSFDPLTFNAINGIYLPDHFFAIDVGVVGGAGAPSVVVAYTEGLNPNNPGKGLGWHSAATFIRVEGTTEVPLTAHGPKKLLKDISSENITSTETTGGFLRVYAGILTGDATTPATGVPFTNADKPGAYNGTLVVTATVP